MAHRIAVSTLNASTIDILNVIRQNATADYQASVPEITKSSDIPKVGEIIYGTPAFANQFLNALVNRIAMMRITSATFNNPYSRLKKGYLEYGESIEEIFVKIANVVEFNPEKAASRELKRTLPDVQSAFHVMNWRVMYPITIQDQDLKQAFLNTEGVSNLIADIVNQVYTAAEYDEFLLFKYLLIKSISKGSFYPVAIGDGTDLSAAAKAFRGTSNKLTLMSGKYNERGVKTVTPRNRQIIFMDAQFNADFDVDVLAAAFNMEKADFMGSLFLIDDWTSFDNERFATIRANSDGVEEVTSDELNLLDEVKAIVVDENWFQVYDNLARMTETYVSSGLYWNYFYHTWKTVSYSPFSNAVVFCLDTATTTLPESLTVQITGKDVSTEAITLALGINIADPTLKPMDVRFVQTQALTQAGIGVQPYGALLIPADQTTTAITLVVDIQGTQYTAASTIQGNTANVSATVTLNKG